MEAGQKMVLLFFVYLASFADIQALSR